jgi:flagellar basal body-associated protein FliL
MAEEEKAAEESSEAKPAAKSRLPLIAGGVVALLLLGGGGTFFVLRKSDAPAEKSAEHAKEEEHADEGEEHAKEEEHPKEEAHGSEHGKEAASEHEEAASEGHGEEAEAEGHGEEGGGGEHGGAPAPQFVSIDSFVVNISDGEGDRFLKAKIDLEVSSAEVGKELEQRMPQVKDIIIGLLSSQNATLVRTMEGKDRLREQVLTRLNAVVRTGVVRQVLFTEFVVQ